MENKYIDLSISHTDLDGYGSTYIVIKLLFKGDADILAWNVDYNKIDKAINTLEKRLDNGELFRSVVITDLNLNMGQAYLLDKLSRHYKFDLLLIDHHVSGSDVASTYPTWYKLNTDYCSSKLVYAYHLTRSFGKDTVKCLTYYNSLPFINMVDAADMFKKDDEKIFSYGRELTTLFLHLKNIYRNNDNEFKLTPIVSRNTVSFFMDKIANCAKSASDIGLYDGLRFHSNEYFFLCREQKEKIDDMFSKYKDQDTYTKHIWSNYIESQYYYKRNIGISLLELYSDCSSIDYKYIEGTDTYALYIKDISLPISDVADVIFHDDMFSRAISSKLSLEQIDNEFSVVLYSTKKGNNIELRSKSSDYNVGRVAKLLNGGGHPQAAGFPKFDNRFDVFEIVVNKLSR